MFVLIFLVAIAVAIVFLKTRYSKHLGTDANTGGGWYFGQLEDRRRLEADRRAHEAQNCCHCQRNQENHWYDDLFDPNKLINSDDPTSPWYDNDHKR